MANKKDIIIAVLATFCLVSALFMILPSRSDPYDAWRDINDDGKIDMKDIGYTIKSFGSTGDSTKNVTVTNWPTKRTLNASLADNLLIDGSQAWLFEADVEGYSRVTLVMKADTLMTGLLSVDVRFKIGGVLSPSIYKNYTHPEGYSFLLQNYEVIGPSIWIELMADGEWRVSIGIYATD